MDKLEEIESRKPIITIVDDKEYRDVIHLKCGKSAFKFQNIKVSFDTHINSERLLHLDNTRFYKDEIIKCESCGQDEFLTISITKDNFIILSSVFDKGKDKQ